MTADRTAHPGPGALAALDLVATWPVIGTAGALTRSSRWVTGPADRVFRWASVTKLLTAMAALVAVEEGTVDLDQPAGPPGSTLRHLLAHASGLPMDGDHPLTAPGTRRIYSNAGIEAAGRAIADASGMAVADYITAAVTEPLGMTSTTVAGSPAWGARGPLHDLLRFGAELLEPTLITPATLAEATSVAFPHLGGVLPGFGRQRPNDWGLGFELRDHKAPHWTGSHNSPASFGHFGRSGSFVWVDPVAGVVCAGLADQDFGPWAATAWPALSDAVLAELGGGLSAPGGWQPGSPATPGPPGG